VDRLCLSCHYYRGAGQRVGPDLSSLNSKPAEILLIDILDPNRQVAPDYAAYAVTVRSGEVVAGLITSETATRVVVRQAGSPDRTFARTEILTVQPSGKSLMPEGLESGLDAQALADILAFLRQ